MTTRPATHAGTWYTADRTYAAHAAAKLDEQLNSWMQSAKSSAGPTSNDHGQDEPEIAQYPLVDGCKAIIGPYVDD